MFFPSQTPRAGIRFAASISFLLMVIKGIVGLFSGSLSILGSAIDSFMDIFVSVANMLALKVSERAGSRQYTYGLGKIQGFSAIFEGFVVGSSGGFLVWSSLQSYTHRTHVSIDMLEIGIMVTAMLGSLAIMWNFRQIQRHTQSLLVESDALHYASDLYMNGGVLLSLIGTRFFGWWWLDAVCAGLIGVYIVYNSFGILTKAVTMLLDRSLDGGSTAKIREIILETSGIESYHNLRTRQSGDDIFLEVHIVFRDKKISLQNAHAISHIIENKLTMIFPKIVVTLHLDVSEDGANESLK